ncbi:hypothetical protein WH47_06905 [Habropoda laboriosa]|uniref:Uncharacterized protein n=1 Tax=Habropoda laboriosa TaxID=597456 RepID=A0A0L7QQC6_9HYME|nr:hypothetical protein WH47_06905 [Habropoda laboriosa]
MQSCSGSCPSDAQDKRNYKTLPPNVLKAIKPVYENLRSETLPERYVSGYTQNNNENANNLIWKISPKEIYSGSTIVEIATNVAVKLWLQLRDEEVKVSGARLRCIYISSGFLSWRHAEEYQERKGITTSNMVRSKTQQMEKDEEEEEAFPA